jgi:hypothetical protein
MLLVLTAACFTRARVAWSDTVLREAGMLGVWMNDPPKRYIEVILEIVSENSVTAPPNARAKAITRHDITLRELVWIARTLPAVAAIYRLCRANGA